MMISCLATYFLEVGPRFSLKVTTKASLRGKQILKTLILGYFSKVKKGGLRPKKIGFSDNFGMLMSGLDA